MVKNTASFHLRTFKIQPILFLLLSMISLAIGTSFAKSLFPTVGAEGATSLRLIYSTVILLIFFQPWKKVLVRNDLLNILPYGIALGGMNLCFYKSLEHIPFGVAVALEFIGPLTLAILSSRHYFDYLWVGLILMGLFINMPSHFNDHSLSATGMMFAFVAGLFWSAYIVFGKKCSTIDAGIATSLGVMVAAIITLPFSLYHSGHKFFDSRYLVIGFFIAALSSALPYTLEMLALKEIPRKNFSILISLEPVICAFAGMAFLNEWLTLNNWIAIILIITASIGSILTNEVIK